MLRHEGTGFLFVDHYAAADHQLPVHLLWTEDHFLAVEARFNLSINRRSAAEHLERTVAISESFFLSMAASAAPSRSLIGGEEELSEKSGLTCDVASAPSRTWLLGELWPSAQVLPWKHTSWLRTCCYSSCKLRQTPEEESVLKMLRNVIVLLKRSTILKGVRVTR